MFHSHINSMFLIIISNQILVAIFEVDLIFDFQPKSQLWPEISDQSSSDSQKLWLFSVIRIRVKCLALLTTYALEI